MQRATIYLKGGAQLAIEAEQISATQEPTTGLLDGVHCTDVRGPDLAYLAIEEVAAVTIEPGSAPAEPTERRPPLTAAEGGPQLREGEAIQRALENAG